MSDTDAYMEAIAEALVIALAAEIATNRPANFIGRTQGGRPIAMADQFFVSVHDGSSQNTAAAEGYYQDTLHSCNITISQRCNISAEDKLGTVVLPAMRARISTITAYLMNNQYTIMAAANAKLTLTNTNGFIEPMRVTTPSVQIVTQRGDWFHARDKNKTGATEGVSATIRLGLARRLQYIGGIN